MRKLIKLVSPVAFSLMLFASVANVQAKDATAPADVLKMVELKKNTATAKFSSDEKHLKEELPAEGSSICQGEKLVVKFSASDTWEDYCTKPIISIEDSDGNNVYYNEESSIIENYSGEEATYSDTLSWDTSEMYTGTYTFWVFNAPCNYDGKLITGWATWSNVPYIKTTFTLKNKPKEIGIKKQTVPAVVSGKKVTAATKKTKAPKITKGKYYKVNSKKRGYSYVKFVVPATGTYKFTVSNVAKYGSTSKKSKVKEEIDFFIKGKSSALKFATQGGNAKWMALKSVKEYKASPETVSDNYSKLMTRYAKMKLKKGKTIYIRSWSNSSHSYAIKITK